MCLSVFEWFNTQRQVGSVKYSSAMKRSELLLHAAPWVHLKGILLKQTKKATLERLYAIWFISKMQMFKDEDDVTMNILPGTLLQLVEQVTGHQASGLGWVGLSRVCTGQLVPSWSQESAVFCSG